MFGMLKNTLFGVTEETEYKLLSTETKVRTPHTFSTLSMCAQPSLRTVIILLHGFTCALIFYTTLNMWCAFRWLLIPIALHSYKWIARARLWFGTITNALGVVLTDLVIEEDACETCLGSVWELRYGLCILLHWPLWQSNLTLRRWRAYPFHVTSLTLSPLLWV